MGIRVTELHCKEVICVGDGRRLGFVSDIELEPSDGRVLALIVPGPCKFWGVLGRKDDFLIPWKAVRRIGPDIILVECRPEECRVPRIRQKWF